MRVSDIFDALCVVNAFCMFKTACNALFILHIRQFAAFSLSLSLACFQHRSIPSCSAVLSVRWQQPDPQSEGKAALLPK